VPPQRSNLVLSADVPNIEACVLILHGFDVEANGGNGVDLACSTRGELEGVEDGFGDTCQL
jgi:hypothetical protein